MNSFANTNAVKWNHAANTNVYLHYNTAKFFVLNFKKNLFVIKNKGNKKCCYGNCGTCDHQCNKLLSCRNHKCLNNCHQGKCYPCTILVELRCPCGQSSIKVLAFSISRINISILFRLFERCLVSKLNQTFKFLAKICASKHLLALYIGNNYIFYFNLPSLPSKCHHEKIQKHKCHYNQCPPCSLKCEKLMDCSHKCQSKCHSAVLTEVVENVKNYYKVKIFLFKNTLKCYKLNSERQRRSLGCFEC